MGRGEHRECVTDVTWTYIYVIYIYVIVLALSEPSTWMTDGPRGAHRMRYWRHMDYTSSVWFKRGFSFRIQNDDSLHCKADGDINQPTRFIGDAVILPKKTEYQQRTHSILSERSKQILVTTKEKMYSKHKQYQPQSQCHVACQRIILPASVILFLPLFLFCFFLSFFLSSSPSSVCWFGFV